jgi:O-antigen/teichoic acid export membrane protein
MAFSKELAKGSLTLFLSVNVFNFFNLIFNFAGARLLGPSDYSVLAALMSIVFIFSIPNETVHAVISRYTTKFFVEKNKGQIKNLMSRALRKFFLISLACFIIFSAISFFLEPILKINSCLLIFTGLFIFGSFLLPVTRGILQGTKKLNSLGFTYVSESSIKLALAIILIMLGFGVYGAIGGVIAGSILAFAFSFLSLKEILTAKSKKANTRGIYKYTFPALVSMASIMIFFSLDIILAKAFFSEEVAGQYSAVSNLGKAIFLGTWGIGRAMFPIVSEKHDRKSESRSLLEQSLLSVFFISLIVLVLYFIFSEQIVGILYGEDYLAGAGLLIYPAIAMAILSLTNVFVLYNLCVNKPRRNYLTIVFAAIQIIVLSLFHSSVLQFSIMLIISNILLFLGIFVASLNP